MDFLKEIKKYGLDKKSYESLLKDIDLKLSNVLKVTWEDLLHKYNLKCNVGTLKKASSTIFGGSFRAQYEKNELKNNSRYFENEENQLNKKLDELKKERVKLQTLSIENNRLLRQDARKEMFYEYVGKCCNSIELPKFQPLYPHSNNCEYLVTLADIHYGASFESENNVYSPYIAEMRMEKLAGDIINFVKKHRLAKISIVELGDSIQGILRVNDLRINDSTMVRATVEVTKLIANFLNSLSEYCVVDYYHVPFANHTQTRNLGTKANELLDEDLEYIIGHYIESLCENNKRINVFLTENNEKYLELNINGNDIIACHGHTMKNYKNSLRNLSILKRKMYSCCLLGHYHSENISVSHESFYGDCETIVAPSFIGSDPFSDSIFKGSKASSLILGFDSEHGHVETYKIFLN